MPQLNLSNQTPLDYESLSLKLTNPTTDAGQIIFDDMVTPIVDHIFTSYNQNPVQLTIDKKNVDSDEIKTLMRDSLLADDIDVKRDEVLSLLVHASSRYRAKTPQNWKHVLANTQLLKNKFPLPTPTLIYTFDTDIQNQAKDVLMQDTPDHRKQLELGLIGNLVDQPISDRWQFIIASDQDYNGIKTQIDQTVQKFPHDQTVAQYNLDLQQIPFDNQNNFTSWVTGNNIKANSLNRLILQAIDDYQEQSYFKPLPLNLQSQVNPIGFAFINIEQLANSDQLSYRTELKKLQEITNKIVQFKIKKLSKIKNANQLNTQPKAPISKHYQKTQSGIETRSHRGFGKKLPSSKRQLQRMQKIVQKHISNAQSDNSYRINQRSFMRPNRRHPNDINLSGNIRKIKYRPDIHIYLDTSGSISEDQYRSSVTLLILIAKKLNTNLYFNSFSHVISQPVKIPTKNQSIGKLYRLIQRIPKVSGGTEYEQVWQLVDKIDANIRKHHQAPRLNFMITDFGYDLRSSYTPQLNHASTKNMYYIPLAADQHDYEYVKKFAEEFANELIDKNDLRIKNRMLM